MENKDTTDSNMNKNNNDKENKIDIKIIVV